MEIQIKIANAFSVDGTGGNPAGVVFDADQLSSTQKQEIAAKAGFPETAFVSASSVADFKLDFFTPIKQIPHCGHATIATFSLLKQNGVIKKNHSSKETIDGRREIVFKGEMAFMEQRAPTFIFPDEDEEAILNSIGINPSALAPALHPTIVNTGNSFLIVPLQNEDILKSVVPNKDEIKRISEKYGLIGYYLFAQTTSSSHDATTRMFAPFYGIDEEAATGMAAGPLAAYLYEIAGIKKDSFPIEQGKHMQPASPSRIQVDLELDSSGIRRLFAGGNAYVSGEINIEMS